MRTEYLPALMPRASCLRCGHTDCCYYTRQTDSCDYLLIEFRRRGCPPTPDCARYAPARRTRREAEEALGARIQAYTDMGCSVRQIARHLRLCPAAVRRARARWALRAAEAARRAE